MSREIPQHLIQESFDASRSWNDNMLGEERALLDAMGEVIQASGSPLTLSHAGLVLTPRVWTPEAKEILSYISNTARQGLQKIAFYLATSPDPLAAGIRENMLAGPHFEQFERALAIEARSGMSTNPYEVGRADIINGGAIEVNAACLDAPIDFHDLTLFLERVSKRIGLPTELLSTPEDSIVELIVATMVEKARQLPAEKNKKPLLAWIGTAKEIYGSRERGGYWSREFRFKQVADAYLKRIGFAADFKVIPVETLADASVADGITVGYRNLLPEDMNEQAPESIEGLLSLATSGRLVGSITAELLTNKASMAILCDPTLAKQAGLTQEEWMKFSAVFPPTAFLSAEYIWVQGQPVKLENLLAEQRENLFFKLSAGEEGHGVFPGSSLTDQKLSELLSLAHTHPFDVIVQIKQEHFPFEVVVADLERYRIERLTGQTDAGTHYALQRGVPQSGGSIVMTRFIPGQKDGTTNGAEGVFRPVQTRITSDGR